MSRVKKSNVVAGIICQGLTCLSLVLLSCTSGMAQSPFEHISIDSALAKAKLQRKLVFVQVAARDCEMCNQVVRTAFEKTDAKEKLLADVIAIYLEAGTPSWLDLQRKYNTREGGLSLFLDEFGTVIQRYNATSSLAAFYVEQINQAKEKAGNGNGAAYRVMEKSYAEGNRSAAFLEKFLLLRNGIGMDTDAMLDAYATSLTPDSTKSKRVLQFLARLAPTLGSPADKVLRNNIALFNQAWLSLGQPERVTINNAIIRKSKQVAVNLRDINAAFRVASFAGSTHFDPFMAQRAYDQNMIDFFRETRDTSKYLTFAAEFYEKYLMSIAVDSIKKIDSTRKMALLASAPTTEVTSTGYRRSVVFSPSTQIYSNQLTVAAKMLYNFSKDSSQLITALPWAQRALEFYESPAAADIQARILYRLGKHDEAITWEQKAILLAKEVNYPLKELELVLAKMKSGQRRIN